MMSKCGAVRLGRTKADDLACSKTIDQDGHEGDHDFTVKRLPDGGWEDGQA